MDGDDVVQKPYYGQATYFNSLPAIQPTAETPVESPPVPVAISPAPAEKSRMQDLIEQLLGGTSVTYSSRSNGTSSVNGLRISYAPAPIYQTTGASGSSGFVLLAVLAGLGYLVYRLAK